MAATLPASRLLRCKGAGRTVTTWVVRLPDAVTEDGGPRPGKWQAITSRERKRNEGCVGSTATESLAPSTSDDGDGRGGTGAERCRRARAVGRRRRGVGRGGRR